MMGIYDPDVGRSIPLEEALRKMDDRWVESGRCCQQTTIDLLLCCRKMKFELEDNGIELPE